MINYTFIPSRYKSEVFLPGMVKIDRAILYISHSIARVIQRLEALKTKSIGDNGFIMARSFDNLITLCRFSGDIYLSENVASALSSYRRISSRTPRLEVIANLKNLLSEIQAYTPDKNFESEDELIDDSNAKKEKVSPDELSKENSVFVIMPFHQDFNDVWKGGIQGATKTAGLHPIRVDTINRSSNITDDIVESIKNCRMAIIDVTGNNPNVMFELGYVMALEKPYIIVSQSVEFLPFDIRNIRTLVYSNSWSGIEELRAKLGIFFKELDHKPKKRAVKKLG